MEKPCLKCGKLFKLKPSEFATRHYCNKVCASKKITVNCAICGKSVTRTPSGVLKVVYCDMACASIGKSERFTKMNIEMNPDRMTLEVRTKLRNNRLGTGEGKGYEKTFGVHTHRIVAAEKLNRPLRKGEVVHRKGEVVHHKDEIKRNNDPDNLEVFTSQAEHALHHKLKQLNER